MYFQRNIGFILLAIYLILIGLLPFIPSMNLPGTALSILALLAGIFILIGK